MKMRPDCRGKGLVYDIQRYSLGDGPGIRTTVFLKGCPLRCVWCQNPESLRSKPEIGFRKERCLDCGACQEACHNGAIRGEDAYRVDDSRCDVCAKCVDVCPARALFLIGRYYAVDELVDEMLQDKVFYDESGGGITLSGGEPTQQYEFTRAFLKACKEAGLDTAIETNGFTTRMRLAEVIPFLDHIYFDLKIAAHEEHKRLTGVDNRPILENARWLARQGGPVTFRMPVVPGMTATKENVRAVAELLGELNVSDIELCPYQDSWIRKLSWLHPNRSLNLESLRIGSEGIALVSVVVEEFSAHGVLARLPGEAGARSNKA